MKILYILNSTNIYGGSTKSFLRYFEALTEKHPEIKTIICAPTDLPNEIAEKYCFKFFKIPIKFFIYPSTKSTTDKLLFLPKLIMKIFSNYLSYRKIYEIAKKEKVDIIHTNVSVVNIGYLVAKKLHLPHIYHLREYQTLDFRMKIIPSFKRFKECLQQANNFSICITHGIQEHFGLDERHSKVIYNGVKHQTYSPPSLSKEKYFLFVGRLEEGKGIKDVIRNFITFSANNEDFLLFIAGDSNDIRYKDEIKSEVSRKKMDQRIIFLGNRKDIDTLMQKAAAIIVPSSKEAFGLITAEAAFNKCLIIGKDTGGTAEQIENGITICGEAAGLRYHSDNELLDCMLRVSQSNNFQPIIESAYLTAQKLYTIENCAQQIYELYTSILMNKQIYH